MNLLRFVRDIFQHLRQPSDEILARTLRYRATTRDHCPDRCKLARRLRCRCQRCLLPNRPSANTADNEEENPYKIVVLIVDGRVPRIFRLFFLKFTFLSLERQMDGQVCLTGTRSFLRNCVDLVSDYRSRY